ncbi:SusD/RagB family nutrient-binding outer membrane lipoprotein [Aquimarina algicola]|uniref:SusD/RagB family nutrient-binding outer membrane lipoprotein n=1 Tax=Aquimarina algicola TaxID=2589995 RepID=A0A504IYT9_9FLAO|nr:SusD/RagB family nutrient-binding outer membrane lipoprotein [Aquimarina algicola]TPN81322.1 SusD/RagB family nutrient-binding outer membrane lipoprotein [Aquimarina algicola]
MKKYIKNIIGLLAIITVLSCETTELDLLDNPNAPPVSVDENTFLNSIEFSFSEFFEDVTSAGAEVVRLEYMFDTYENQYINTNPDLAGAWRQAYSGILKDVQTLLPVAEENELYIHSGISKTLRAYVLMTLVDYFGNVPYSEALQGEEGVTFPQLDEGVDVYAAALADLNDALNDFSRVTDDTPEPTSELFYGSNIDKWIKLVNTLKFKYYLNTRLINETESANQIANLISENNLISTASDNFYWRAGTADLPQSRHQYYVNEYLAASTGDYISNYLMWTLTIEKGLDDPRLRYYVYRQTNEFPTSVADLDNQIDCWNDPRPATYAAVDAISAAPLPFCSLFGRGDGYWGRDHAEQDGIPPDNTLRSTYGVYPAGGRFDDNDGTRVRPGQGLDGAGIWPIMTDSFVYFMRAEAAIFLGTTDDSRMMLEQGTRKSISNVMALLTNPENFDNVPETTDVDNYITAVLNLYDGAGTDTERMNVIGKEYWISLFGNGVEGYNLFRRTGTPNNLQPTLLGTGNFPRTFLYPNIAADRNTNISNADRSFTDKTFWDTNPDELK